MDTFSSHPHSVSKDQCTCGRSIWLTGWSDGGQVGGRGAVHNDNSKATPKIQSVCGISKQLKKMFLAALATETRALISVQAGRLSKKLWKVLSASKPHVWASRFLVPKFATRCRTDNNAPYWFKYLPPGAALSTMGAAILDHSGSHGSHLPRQGVCKLQIEHWCPEGGCSSSASMLDDDGTMTRISRFASGLKRRQSIFYLQGVMSTRVK